LAFNDFPPDYGKASALSIGLLLLSAFGVWLYARASRDNERFATVSGKAFRPHRIELGRWRWPVISGLAVYGILVVALPVLVIVWASFLPYFAPPSWEALGRIGLENFHTVLTDNAVPKAFRNTLTLAVLCSTAVMFFSAVTAWVRHRSRVPGAKSLEFLAMLPIAIPGLVLGMAMIVMYIRVPVPIYGTIWILFLAYCVKFLPYGMQNASGSITQLNRELEEASSMSGGSWWSTFRHVVLPLLRPGLVAGWIYIFIGAFREFSTSVLLVGNQGSVLSVVAYTKYELGDVTVVAALGVLMMCVSIPIVAVFYRVSARVGVHT
jgi:iron(III) transport system permease protein